MNKFELLSNYLISNLNQVGISILSSSIVGVFTINFSSFIEQWFISNADYIFIALLFVAADYLLGTVVHAFYKRDFKWSLNILGFSMKLGLVVIMGVLFEALAHLIKSEDLVYNYLKLVGRLIVCIYPLRSAFLNSSIITKGIFPPGIVLKIFDGFNKDLSLDHFKNKKKDE